MVQYNVLYFHIIIEIVQELSKKKSKTRIKSYDDLFLHTCSDCEVSFQELLHHIDFNYIDDV